MDTQEIDSTLDELENRLDRLRALYEQYFLGIEKIEPAVARKDVDRRFWLLRRTQIRNTARRWRLQVLIQRYNTFQQYWTRICREIENGTYVRHLLKAKKNLGAEPKTWAAKKRMGLLRRDRIADPSEGATANGAGELAGAASNGTGLGGEASATGGAAALESREPVRAKAAMPRPGVAVLNLEDLGPLDLDFEEEPAPLPRRAAEPGKAPPAREPPRATVDTTKATSAAARPAPPPAQAGLAGSPRPDSPRGPEGGLRLPTARSALGTPAGGALPPGRPPLPAAARPPGGMPGPARPAGAPPPAPAGPASPQRPPSPAPLATSATSATSPRPAAPPVSGGGLSEERVRTLHAELVATKRRLNLGDSVSIDSLAKSLRDTETKLRAQHGGRSVDFQIVVKDGKPVVKPVLRK